MKMFDLARRAHGPEMMDNPDVDPRELDHAMNHLKVINRALNGYGPTLAGMAHVLPADCTEFSLMDVGCGSGDTLRQIAKWARKRDLRAHLVGVELSERSALRAADECRDYPEIVIRHQDFLNMVGERFDVVHGALMLHHFDNNSDAVRILKQMAGLAYYGIVINDLHRNVIAWQSIRALTRAFSRSPILRNDAPLSVARGFTRKELFELAKEADLQDVRIHWRWAFRWLLIARGMADE